MRAKVVERTETKIRKSTRAQLTFQWPEGGQNVTVTEAPTLKAQKDSFILVKARQGFFHDTMILGATDE